MPESPRDASLVKLAHDEFRQGRQDSTAAVSRLVRTLAPDEPEPQRLLSLVSSSLRGHAVAADHPAHVHVALGDAYRLMGDTDAAIAAYETALALDGTLVRAHLGLASARMPGIGYHEWLRRLHELLRPGVYLEVGVANGRTLALARPPTVALGVDPVPSLAVPVTAETHIFAEPSDEFFVRDGLRSVLGDRRLDLAFIDGLHTFEQTLRDVMHVEARSTTSSVIVLHDTLPLDEVTQRRDRETQFWTGDVWKVVRCLRAFRPDLEILTIATPPSGLTLVRNLDPGSSVLGDVYAWAVDRFIGASFSTLATTMDADLCVVPNDWDAIAERLRPHPATDELGVGPV
jgi:hypothetical protein